MTARPTFAAMPARPVRGLALWLALLVALGSALAGTGLPRSTAIGSAFNPATTAEALRPLRPALRLAIPAIRSDDGPAAGPNRAVIATIAPLPPPSAAGSAPSPFPVSHPAVPVHPVRTGPARAPPVA